MQTPMNSGSYAKAPPPQVSRHEQSGNPISPGLWSETTSQASETTIRPNAQEADYIGSTEEPSQGSSTSHPLGDKVEEVRRLWQNYLPTCPRGLEQKLQLQHQNLLIFGISRV